MIKLFRQAKILFFPVTWANAVTRWITGVYSPDGTVRVKNTNTPGDDGSLQLEVNVEAVYARIVKMLDKRGSSNFLTREKISEIRNVIRGYIDGVKLVIEQNHITISEEFLNKLIRDASEQVYTQVFDDLKKSGANLTTFSKGTATTTTLPSSSPWEREKNQDITICFPVSHTSPGTQSGDAIQRTRFWWAKCTFNQYGILTKVESMTSTLDLPQFDSLNQAINTLNNRS